jgi:hypothetical protein
MHVAKFPASVRRSFRRSKYRSDRWLTATWDTLSSGVSAGLSAGLSSGLFPGLRPIALVPVVLPIATIATPIGHAATLPHQTSYANRFVSPPAEVRGPIVRMDLAKARVAGLHLGRPTVTAPTIESQASDGDKIYNAERRLQLAHAINDRDSIAQIRAELDRLF